MSLDPAQRAAAEAPASVVVLAGAGTGKTHMLAHRYLEHLRRGLRPLEVVAVTFTRRAAEELRARIREAVRSALAAEAAGGAGDPDAGAAGGPGLDPDVLAEVEAAPIGTLHALAQAICRRHPEAAGVPPDFGVVDELDGALWVSEAIDEALAALPDAAFGVLPLDLWRATLRAALEDPTRLRAALDVTPAAARDAVARWRREAFAASVGSAAWHAETAFLAAAAGPPGHATELTRATAVAADARLRALGPDGDAGEAAAAWAELVALPYSRGAKKDWTGPDLGAVKDALKRLRELARAAWDDGDGAVAYAWGAEDERAAARVAHVRATLDAALAAVEARKRRAKALTFADLETHAARALADPEVRADLHARWRALLLDEAQDVNPTQAALLRALRAADAPLTAVGDPKQSIYGFRGAAPEVLADLRREVGTADGGRVVELRTSYRSQRALVDAVNVVFDHVFGAEAGPLAAVRPPRPDAGPPLRRRTVVPARDADAAARAAAEAEAIADALHALLAADPPLLVSDPRAPGGQRPLAVDDVAVLARGRAALEVLEARLPARGVPVLHAGGGDVLATPTARDVRALLRAVVDPTDAVAVAAVVRSPYVAAADAAIVRFATAVGARGDAPWWRRLAAADDPELRHAAALLDELRAARAAGVRASDLVRLADDRSGFRAVLAHLPQGPRRVADHDGLVALLERLEAGHADALGVVRRLERYAAAGVEVPRPSLRARGAVALLTIHAAKGLEWPVVVVADLGGRGRNDAPDVLLDPDVGVALRGRDADAQGATYRAARAAARTRELAEARRLAYVACTRARDLLILSDRGGGAAGLAAALDAALDAAGVAPEPVAAAAGVAAAPPLPPAPPAPDPDDPAWRRRVP